MKCEVEFLAVGDASRAGDAIVVRYGEEHDYKLMLIDGGTLDTGTAIVNHLRSQFGGNVVLTHVVLTHADGDHASGLRTVLQNIPVENLWMHIPWFLCSDSIGLFSSKNWTQSGLSAAIEKEYDILSEIFDIATLTGVAVHYPLAGAFIGPFVVLSPTKNAYVHLLPQFDKTPEPDQALLESLHWWLGKGQSSLVKMLVNAAIRTIQSWIKETWTVEYLRDGGVTSASNESSVVLYANLEAGPRVLLTGDAGINALTWAKNYAQSAGYPIQDFHCIQIPHHGSRRNVGPTILNELIGPIQAEGTTRFLAYVSAPKDDDKHPRKIVLNAFTRRGGRVMATQGSSKVFWGGFSPRPGYVVAQVEPLHLQVEDYT